MQAARLPTWNAGAMDEEVPVPLHAPATTPAGDGAVTARPGHGNDTLTEAAAAAGAAAGAPEPPLEEVLAARQSRNSAAAEKMGGGQKLRDHRTAQRRLMQDYRTFQENIAEGGGADINALPVDGDFFHWHAVIAGPCDTPWEGGLFKLDLHFGDDYPFSPPKVRFRTKDVFHPNVYVDGNICMDTLKSSWQSSLNVEALLISIQSLLSDPNPLSAANGAAARLLTENRSAYDEKIRTLVEASLEQSFSDLDDADGEEEEG
ncbi:ubiquitin-conjugating enzyme-like protein [Novymonas esmeraldas]|uniref:Ubiquitin-conjugating enzyme-like protein n=1 Tax=Novymonas esmeraldas TaxID=1808958 RepID=A0AAW0ESL7_9TRYP